MNPYQPQPYQQYRPGPPTRRMSGGKVFLIVAGSVIGVLTVLGAIGAALAPHARQHHAATGQQPQPAAAQKSTGAPQVTTSARPKAKVLATFSGTGDENTPKFTVTGPWKLKWRYDCSSLGFKGNFIVLEDHSFTSKVDVNEEGKAGHGATWAYGDTGRHFLDVTSECGWSVKVIGTK